MSSRAFLLLAVFLLAFYHRHIHTWYRLPRRHRFLRGISSPSFNNSLPILVQLLTCCDSKPGLRQRGNRRRRRGIAKSLPPRRPAPVTRKRTDALPGQLHCRPHLHFLRNVPIMADELPAENQHYGGDSWGEDGFDVTDSGHQQDIHHSDQHTQDPDVSLSHASGEPNTNGAEDGYEPSLSAPPVLKKTPSPSSQATGKPKMSGGFLVGSSDDEDDEDATPIGSTAQGNTHNHPNPSPFQVSTSAQAQPDIVTTGAALVSPSKIRHPQDIIGSLEDRVKEDPRGDMDAWLALMAEYRRRTKFDDLRAVYNRFLEVFPQAVR